MKVFKGSVASEGVATGIIREIVKEEKSVRRNHIDDTQSEKQRFLDAQNKAMEELEGLYDIAVKEVGQSNALIFDIHKMMLEDEDYVDSVLNIIDTQCVNSEYAVAVTGDNFARTFSEMDDEYMKERAADVKDISERIINILSDRNKVSLSSDVPCIIVADDLTPSETVQMDKKNILGFVTRKGSVNSHTAILARTMGVPAMVGVDVGTGVDGINAVIDGFDGTFSIDPDIIKLADAKVKLEKVNKEKALLREYKGRETATKSGRKLNLYANIGSISDVGNALMNDAEGIGLFRSEFLYLEQKDFPGEDYQFGVYKQVAEMMGGKKVIIRTLDIGADKQIDYFNLEHEENPALGYRAVRICLTQEDIFRTQISALIRASYYGNISIMVPMITSVWEVIRVKEIIKETEEKLKASGIPFGSYEFGIMIETPAAVMIADELAKHVDYFSIGTNDLSQYTLAVDRQNQKLEKFFDPHHPAILRMIEMVAKAGRKNNIWTGICGELGADTSLTKTFLEYGIDELSVSPTAIFSVRQTVCNLD